MSRMTVPQAMATVNPWTVPVVMLAVVWAASSWRWRWRRWC